MVFGGDFKNVSLDDHSLAR